MQIYDFLRMAEERKASDLILTVGVPPLLKINMSIIFTQLEALTLDTMNKLIGEFISRENLDKLQAAKELDFSYSVPGLARFRVNIFQQRGSFAAVFRRISSEILSFEELGLPEAALKYFCDLKEGLVLVTGSMGSGKTTTLASIIEYINNRSSFHIITIEDPIEYLFKHKKSIIEQREVRIDTPSFGAALRNVMRQSPDIVLIGELHDLETISSALTAAETGILVLGTLHTPNASETVNRIVDIFPASQHHQIRMQLASNLTGVISQQLMPRSDKAGLVVASEVLVCLPNVRALIRDGNVHQLQSIMETNPRAHMQTMDQSLLNLYEKKKISKENLLLRLKDKANENVTSLE